MSGFVVKSWLQEGQLLIIIIFTSFLSSGAFAQSLLKSNLPQIDSIENRLAEAKHDTEKVRLRCILGVKKGISRSGYWDTLVKLARSNNLTLFECRTLLRLGFILNQQQKEGAMNCLSEAVKIAEANGYKRELVIADYYFGEYYSYKNETKKAVDFCLKGLKGAEDLKYARETGLLYLQLADLYFTMGDISKALKTHFDCLRIFEKEKLNEYIPTALMSIGGDYRELKDEVNATKYYMAILPYASQFVEGRMLIYIYNAVGDAYEMKKMPDSAAYYYLESYDIAKRLKVKRAMASCLALLATNNRNVGNYKMAKKYGLLCLDIARSINFPLQIQIIARTLKEIYLAEGNYKDAFRYYEIQINTRDSIHNESTRKETLEKQFAYNIEKKENENKLLASQNQVQALQLSQNRYFMIGLAALLLFVLIIAFLVIYQNRLRNNKQTSELEQKLLRSQMNPHFIFNSLQAIQNFMLKRDNREAVRYLSSFAGITRDVLENSRIEAVPIKKEVTLLENYLQLQKLRFEDRFDYRINIDPKIDIEHLTVPPMLLQPFIENAIEHGMHGIEAGGLIDISYRIKDNFLIVEITDNGRGMVANNRTDKQHRSLALEITRERIELMNRKARRKITFVMNEAFPEEPLRKGVKVKFNLPVEFQFEEKSINS